MYFLLCPLQTQNDRSVCEIYVSNLLKRWPNPKSISTLFSDCIGVLVGAGERGRAVHHTTCWETISGTTSFEDWTMFYPMPTPSVSYRPVGCSYRVMCMNNYAIFSQAYAIHCLFLEPFSWDSQWSFMWACTSSFSKNQLPFSYLCFPQLVIFCSAHEYLLAEKLLHWLQEFQITVDFIEDILPSTKPTLNRLFQQVLSFAKAYES